MTGLYAFRSPMKALNVYTVMLITVWKFFGGKNINSCPKKDNSIEDYKIQNKKMASYIGL